MAIWTPGKQDAKTMPVRSRWVLGTCQFRIKRSPPFPTCSSGVNGIPASRRARSPDAIASWVVMSHAMTIFGSMPNSLAKSNAPLTPASCGISSKLVACSMLTEPSRPLIRRLMFLSRRRCLYSSVTSWRQVSPRTSRSNTSSSKTLSPPGSPRLIPDTTYGSARRCIIGSWVACV
ncbi:MAG: Uncharacterised protein [Candidatus Poseidoniaceae archaeon]|nr:MAG: Uncharacterised protein [Candidatus Poseidoniaceae archaeon]